MGACASVPKAMRSKSDAPAPEPKEEVHTVKEVKVEDASEKKVDAGEEKVEEKTQSLGTLLVETEAPKEAVKEEVASTESTKVETTESTAAEVLPVSEPAAPAPAVEVAAPAEEKKSEVAEKK